jgi:hypothetical protein
VLKNKSEQPIGEWILKRREKWYIQISRVTERIVRVVRGNIPKGRVQENPRSAGPAPFLQETGYEPNQKKGKKKERKKERRRRRRSRRRMLFPTHPFGCRLYIGMYF